MLNVYTSWHQRQIINWKMWYIYTYNSWKLLNFCDSLRSMYFYLITNSVHLLLYEILWRNVGVNIVL